WNQKCGIAAYSRHLIEQSAHDRVLLFAPEAAELSTPDEATVTRCWLHNDRDDLPQLGDALLEQPLDVVVIQAHIYFYDFEALSRLMARLKAQGIVVTLTLHATFAPDPR